MVWHKKQQSSQFHGPLLGLLLVLLALGQLRDPVLAVPAGGSHWAAVGAQVALLAAAVEGALDDDAAEAVGLQAHGAGGVAALVQSGEVGVVGVVGLRLLGLAVVQVVLLDLLLLHHWLQRLLLLLLLDGQGQLAGPLLGLRSMFLDQFLQLLLGNEVLFFDDFKEGVHEVLRSAALLLLPAAFLADLQKVEQLQHALLLPDLLDDLLVPEYGLSLAFEATVDVLQLIVELHLALHDAAETDEDVPELVLEVDLVDLDAAAASHLLELRRALVEAAAECLDAGLRGQQQEHVCGQFEALREYLVEGGLEVHDGEALGGQRLGAAGRLHEHHVHVAPVHREELLLADLHVALDLVDLGVVEQAAQLLAVEVVGHHLHAGAHVCQLYGCPAHAREPVQDHLRPCALAGHELGDLLRRSPAPGALVQLHALVEALEDHVALVPEAFELGQVEGSLLLLLAFGRVGEVVAEAGEVGVEVHALDAHQQVALVHADRNQLLLRVAADRTAQGHALAPARPVLQLDVHRLLELAPRTLGLLLEQSFPPAFAGSHVHAGLAVAGLLEAAWLLRSGDVVTVYAVGIVFFYSF